MNLVHTSHLVCWISYCWLREFVKQVSSPVSGARPGASALWTWTRAGMFALVIFFTCKRAELNGIVEMMDNSMYSSWANKSGWEWGGDTEHSLPGSMAAEMSDWASRTLFMASSISLLEASAFSPGFKFSPAANGFNLQVPSIIWAFLKRRFQPTHCEEEDECIFLLGIHGLHELQEVCRQSLTQRTIHHSKELLVWHAGTISLTVLCSHLGVHVCSRYSHGSHLIHVGSSETSKWCCTHLKRDGKASRSVEHSPSEYSIWA